MPYAQEQMGFKRPPKLFLRQDSENAQNPLGKTAFYDPQAESVTLYVTDRHPKDIMRSLSHELVHHTQNCNGKFDHEGEMGEGYAQNNPHLRGMEREAYEKGNLCFRDWEDGIKGTIYFEHLQKGVKTMSTKNWKNKELTTLLSEAWGFGFTLDTLNEKKAGKDWHKTGKKEGEKDADDEKEDYTAKKEKPGADKRKGAEKRGAEATKKKTSGKGRGEKKGDDAYVNENSITEDSGEEEKRHYEDNAWHDEDHIEAIEKHLRALKKDRDYDEGHEELEEGHDPDWGMGKDEKSRTRPGEEDYTGHKGDESKTHAGEDYEGDDVEGLAGKAKDALHALASAVGVDLEDAVGDDDDEEVDVEDIVGSGGSRTYQENQEGEELEERRARGRKGPHIRGPEDSRLREEKVRQLIRQSLRNIAAKQSKKNG